VVAEVLRTLRPGGVLALTAWAPGGAFDMTARDLAQLVPALAGAPDRTRWASAEGVGEILRAAAALPGCPPAELVGVRRDTVGFAYPSVPAAVDELRHLSGPWAVTFDALEAAGMAERGTEVLTGHLERYAVPTQDGVRIDVGYAVATLRRTG
jgi:hypothetical protein